MTKLTQPANPVLERVCIRVEGELASPLTAGSGEAERTGRDVILDSRGMPFVPGSSLAGALRQYLAGAAGTEAADALFGSLRTQRQSRLSVYDMELNNAVLSTRDGVRLDAYKTAVFQGKYDLETVSPGAAFVIRLEWVRRSLDPGDTWPFVCTLLEALRQGEVTLGGKTTRGYGRLKTTAIRLRTFQHLRPEDSRAWLDWSWDAPDAFPETGEPEGARTLQDVPPLRWMRQLTIPLAIRGTLIIRNYAEPAFGRADDPDYVQLTTGEPAEPGADDDNQRKNTTKAVIPGTSWTGAIRGRLISLLEELGIERGEAAGRLEALFGSQPSEKKGPRGALKASLLRVEESVVEGGGPLPLTRTAIDRFTGGTVTGALYTSMPWAGGRTTLVLRWPETAGGPPSEVICGLLLWIAEELNWGLLAVGGETAAGRGVFQADGEILLDGEPLTAGEAYQKAALDWCRLAVKEETAGAHARN